MSPRDRSAERRVAAFLSQNSAAPVKKSEQPEPDLFAPADTREKRIDLMDALKKSLAGRARLSDEFIEQPPVAHHSETSREAAQAIAPTRRSKMFLVYHHIKALGQYGATRQEIVDALAISLQTVCSLVNNLYTMGLIGSNCLEGCTTKCEHKPVSRRNRFSSMDNEVMLHEDHVIRWDLARQARPAERPNWERGK